MVRHLFAKCKNVVVSECALSPEWPGGTDRSRASGWTDGRTAEQRAHAAAAAESRAYEPVCASMEVSRSFCRRVACAFVWSHLLDLALASERAYRIPQQKFGGGVRH